MRKPTGPGKTSDNLDLPPALRQGLTGLLFNFDIDDSTVKPEHQAWLTKNAGPLVTARASEIFLKGNASRSGDADYNLKLSDRRIQAVKDFLIKLGARNEQFKLKAVGEEEAALTKKDGTEDEIDRAVQVTIRLPRGSGVMRFERVDPADVEDGFEINRAPQWLMVSAFGARRTLVLLNGAGVRLFTNKPGVVQMVSPFNIPVNEFIVSSNREKVTFEGNMPGDAIIFAHDLVTGAILPLLEISVLFPKTVRIATHLVTDPQHPTPGRSIQSVRDMFKDANRIYQRQANVSIASIGDPKPLAFATNLSDTTAPLRNGQPPITGKTVGGETFPVLSRRGDGTARVNVFFVWEWEPDDPDTQAEADGIPGKNVIYEDDVSATIGGVVFNNPGLTFSHEFGHCFGLEHTGTEDPSLAARLMFNRSNRRGLLSREEILIVHRLA